MLANPDREHAALREAATAPPPGGSCAVDATAPSGISARGWSEVLRRTASRVSEARLLGEAAAVAFYALLALFPATAAFVWICGLLVDPVAAAERLRDAAPGTLPTGAAEVAREVFGRLAARPGGLETSVGAAAVGAALWSGTAAAAQLFGGLNAAYGERESRGLFRLYAVALLFALGGGAFVVLALGAIAAPAALAAQAGPAGDGAEAALSLGRWPALLAAVSVGLAVVYRHGPSRGCPRWRWVSWGGGLAALAWLLGSAAFSFYVGRVGGYDQLYGSLGAVAGLMTWAWLSSAAVLVGAALNAELEREAVFESPPR